MIGLDEWRPTPDREFEPDPLDVAEASGYLAGRGGEKPRPPDGLDGAERLHWAGGWRAGARVRLQSMKLSLVEHYDIDPATRSLDHAEVVEAGGVMMARQI